MEDFCPFRSEDIPELVKLVQQSFVERDRCGKKRKENAISFLLPLVIELLDDVGRIKSLNKKFLKEFGENRYVKVSDGFWKIVRVYLKVNNGTGNLSRITELLKSNGHWRIADGLEKFFVRYSLPMISDGNVNVYSLSRDFLCTEKKDITAGNSLSILNVNSVEKALQNSVILEEIFKKLQFADQKLFRLVSPTWLEETLPFWRRNSRILLHVSGNVKDNEHCGISLSVFMDLWERHRSDRVAKRNVQGGMVPVDDAGNYKLQDCPFRSYQVSYKNCRKSKGDILSCGKSENKFWKSCGLFIEDLEIKNASASIKICKGLLQEFCQNLKRLKISCCKWARFTDDTSGSEEDEKETKQDENKKEANSKSDKMEVKLNNPEMKFAENLHTLILEDIDEDSLRSLLFICSNLKTLVLESYKETLGALLSPTSTGEFIKLKKLVLLSYINEDLFSLRQYTAMLAKNKFDSLEHLKLAAEFFNARFPPFNLYAALAQTSRNLKTLELELAVLEDDGAGEYEKFEWFIDVSPFPFPNLTELTFELNWSNYTDVHENPNFDMKFDFGTLKGMPMLKRLQLKIKNPEEEVFRSPGALDWVFEGDRNRYLPTGVTVDYQYSKDDPILCNNLKEFAFDGWSLNEEDVRLLSSWFPNLTRLEAEVRHEALSSFLENWPQLKKLVIHTEKCISLGKLRQLQEKKKHVRIFQRFLKDKVVTDESVELKERNGWLFFNKCEFGIDND